MTDLYCEVRKVILNDKRNITKKKMYFFLNKYRKTFIMMKHLEIENYKLHILAQIAHHHHQKSEHDELTLLKPWQKFDLL